MKGHGLLPMLLAVIVSMATAVHAASWLVDGDTLPVADEELEELAAASQAADPAAGQDLEPLADEELQALLEECSSCHGPRGVSAHAYIPTLAGQPVDQIVVAIEKFYFYERHCPDTTPRHGDRMRPALNMCEVSGRMTERQALALGEYYAAQEPPPAGDAQRQD